MGKCRLPKTRASFFHGAELAGILPAKNVDTVLMTGVTACACVLQTICAGTADGLRTIAVTEATPLAAPVFVQGTADLPPEIQLRPICRMPEWHTGRICLPDPDRT